MLKIALCLAGKTVVGIVAVFVLRAEGSAGRIQGALSVLGILNMLMGVLILPDGSGKYGPTLVCHINDDVYSLKI